MRRRHRLYAGVILLGLPATGMAAGITYDCDTAANHFSELNLPAVAVPFTVSGSVKLNTIAASTGYVAVARIQIASPVAPGRTPEAYAGLSLSALSARGKKLPSGAAAIQMLSYTVAGREDEAIPLSVTDKPGTVEPFRLSYDGHAVTVSIGTAARTFPLATASPIVRIVCSTGEFLFADLVIEAAR